MEQVNKMRRKELSEFTFSAMNHFWGEGFEKDIPLRLRLSVSFTLWPREFQVALTELAYTIEMPHAMK